jgi:organic radical activating enzyme
MNGKLGRYCIDLGDGVYYDTLNHIKLSADQLEQQLMLAGQEREALIEAVLTIEPAGVTIVPSWECNLRCPHCYVGHLLQRPSGNKSGNINLDAVIALFERVATHPGWGVHSYVVVGGEPLLHPDLLRGLQSRLPYVHSITTNGVWNWDEVVDVLANPKLNVITFSIDGLPEDHNRIRRSLDHIPNAFGTTYRNLARATRAFPDKTISVQGSVVDRNYGETDYDRFAALMLLAGVHPTNIRIGTAAPTRLRASLPVYDKIARISVRQRPCCDYKLGRQLVIVGDDIYPTYYGTEGAAPLGTIHDDPGTLLAAQRAYILDRMPILHDPICRDQCTAVGICWGLCSTAERNYPVEASNGCGSQCRPSSACDRELKELIMPSVASDGLVALDKLTERRHLIATSLEDNHE